MSRPSARALLLTFSLAAILLGPVAGRAQDTTPGTPLTLEECIARAMQKNFDLQIQAYSTDAAKESLVVANTDFDPTITASLNRSLSQAASTTSRLDGTAATGPRSDNTTTRLGISQKLAQTNATVGLTTNLTRSATNSLNSLINPNFGDTLTATVSQPLLKNFGSAVARANVERTKLGVGIANLGYKSRVLTVLRDTENAYNNLVSARETVRIRQLSLDLAQKLYDENVARRNTGVLTDLDVLSAEVGVANARRAVVQADQGVRTAEDSLLTLINADDFNKRPGPVNFPEYKDPAPSFDVSYKLARDSYPDYLSAVESIKQLEIDAATARKNRLPSLNLDGSLGYNATDRSYSDVVGALPNHHGNNWSLGLTYTMPWGMRADNSRYRTALISLNSQKARLAQLDQSLLVQVRAAIDSVQTNRVSVEIASKATELSEKQYELQKARFDAGLSTSRLVLQAQDDLETARLAELTAKVTLRTSVAELHRLEGTSIARFKVQIPE